MCSVKIYTYICIFFLDKIKIKYICNNVCINKCIHTYICIMDDIYIYVQTYKLICMYVCIAFIACRRHKLETEKEKEKKEK